MILLQNEKSNKEYLYYLIIGQLYSDGYNDQAAQLETHILQCDNVVPPCDNLANMVASSIQSCNGIHKFFNQLQDLEEEDISDMEHTPQLVIEDSPPPPGSVKKGAGRPRTNSQPGSNIPIYGSQVTNSLPGRPRTNSQPSRQSSSPPVAEHPAGISDASRDATAGISTGTAAATTSLHASLQTCVEMLSNEVRGAAETGQSAAANTLTNDSISEVFQIITNLTKLNNGGGGGGAGAVSIKEEPEDYSDTIANLAAGGEPSLEENIDKAIETLQQTLTTLKDDTLTLPNSLTGTPNMLGLTENHDFGPLSDTPDNNSNSNSNSNSNTVTKSSLVKPFSLADKQLRCNKCDYLTFSKRAYTLHLRSHDETPVRKGDRISFTKHNYSGNKNVIRPYACKMCKYRAPSRIQLTLHVRTHTGEKPHPCPYCDYRTAQKGNLKKHIEFRHARSKSTNEHCCTLCNFRASSRMQLSLHINQSHQDSEKSERDEELEKRYQCKLCEFRCVWVGSLRSHMFDKHPDSMARNRTDPPEHKCSMCEYTSQWRGNLKTHMLRKHAPPEVIDGFYHCKRCDYKTEQQEELNTHYEVHVSDERPYQCNLCDYRAGLKNTLETHMKYKHSDEKPFHCEVCSYRCVTKGQLTIHQRKHTGERPYKCPYCPYDTAQQSNLKSHVKHRHPNQNQHIFNSRRGRKRKYLYPEDDVYQMYNAVTMAYNLNSKYSDSNLGEEYPDNSLDQNSLDQTDATPSSAAQDPLEPEVMVPFAS